MRQAVRVGRQVLLPRIRSRAKPEFKRGSGVSSTNVGAVSGQRLCTFLFKRFVEHWDGSMWSLKLLTFLPINLDKGPSTAAMDVGLARLPATARLPVRKPGPVDR